MSSSTGVRTQPSQTKAKTANLKTGDSTSYFKKSAPPLHLETLGSRSQAIVVFCLHLLALSAMFGASAHLLHCLLNEVYLQQDHYQLGHKIGHQTGQQIGYPIGQPEPSASQTTSDTAAYNFSFASVPITDNAIVRSVESPGTLLILVAAMAVLVTMAGMTLAILRSAINAHNDACKRVWIRWNPDGTLAIKTAEIINNLPFAPGKQYHCQLEPGSYNSHWLVILRCSLDVSHTHQADPALKRKQQKRKRFCILLARDSLSFASFRHLRLWMRLVAPTHLSKLNGQSGWPH